MKIANKIEIPDECPENCKFKGESFYQGSMCSRCPVFCCVVDDNGFCLIDAPHYREDWAQEFAKFFAGESDYPNLVL